MSSTFIVDFTPETSEFLVGDTPHASFLWAPRRPSNCENIFALRRGASNYFPGSFFIHPRGKPEVFSGGLRSLTLESQKNRFKMGRDLFLPSKKKTGTKFQPTFSEGLWPWCDTTILPFQSVSFFRKVGGNSRFQKLQMLCCQCWMIPMWWSLGVTRLKEIHVASIIEKGQCG